MFFDPSLGESGWETIIDGMINIDTWVDTFLNWRPEDKC